MLRVCFDIRHRNTLTESLQDIHEIIDITNEYMKFSEVILTRQKVLNMYGNKEPWITSPFRKKISKVTLPFPPNSPEYQSKQRELNKEIDAKRVYKNNFDRPFHESNRKV